MSATPHIGLITENGLYVQLDATVPLPSRAISGPGHVLIALTDDAYRELWATAHQLSAQEFAIEVQHAVTGAHFAAAAHVANLPLTQTADQFAAIAHHLNS